MITKEPTNQRPERSSYDVPISTLLKESVLNSYARHESKLNCLDSSETEIGFHYSLKLPGYLQEDFSCFFEPTHLVITTEKNVQNRPVSGHKHSYCYPSAYFKVHIPLPKVRIKDNIEMIYHKDFLHVNLFKVN